MNLNDLMAAALAQGNTEGDAVRGKAKMRKHPIDPMAQKMELADRWLRAQERPERPLMAGDLCREKPGLPMLTNAAVLILWRFLDMDDLHDQWIIRDTIKKQYVSRIDCIVGILDDGAHTIGLLPFESWRLERLEDGERRVEEVAMVMPRRRRMTSRGD